MALGGVDTGSMKPRDADKAMPTDTVSMGSAAPKAMDSKPGITQRVTATMKANRVCCFCFFYRFSFRLMLAQIVAPPS